MCPNIEERMKVNEVFSHKWVRQYEIKAFNSENFSYLPINIKSIKDEISEQERNSTLFESVVQKIKETNKTKSIKSKGKNLI